MSSPLVRKLSLHKLSITKAKSDLAPVDPLRKRPTTFSRSTKEVNTDSSVWTETPSEKARRIADEVSGIKRKKPIRSGEGAGEDETDRARKRQRDRDILEGVERHNVGSEVLLSTYTFKLTR